MAWPVFSAWPDLMRLDTVFLRSLFITRRASDGTLSPLLLEEEAEDEEEVGSLVLAAAAAEVNFSGMS